MVLLVDCCLMIFRWLFDDFRCCFSCCCDDFRWVWGDFVVGAWRSRWSIYCDDGNRYFATSVLIGSEIEHCRWRNTTLSDFRAWESYKKCSSWKKLPSTIHAVIWCKTHLLSSLRLKRAVDYWSIRCAVCQISSSPTCQMWLAHWSLPSNSISIPHISTLLRF